MNLDSQLFYSAKSSLRRLQAFKKSFINDLFNGFICGNDYKDYDPQFNFVEVYNTKDSEDKALEKFEKNLNYNTLDSQIEIKTKELSILLDAREQQLKKQYNKYSKVLTTS